MLWRRRLLVDETTRLPILAPATGGAPPFIALDPQSDGHSQLGNIARPGAAVRFIDPTFELGRYDAVVRACVVRGLTMAHWFEETQFCATCTEALRWDETERLKICANRSTPHRHFPRIDPATIMLVEDGESMLLGRSPGWPDGLYSTLAGFIEAGESAEEAVAREVFEEAGVRVDNIRYVASEPWPFPRSLMFGFYATATTTSLVRGDELEDLRWFDVEEGRRLQRTLADRMPYADTIARRLIAAWLDAKR